MSADNSSESRPKCGARLHGVAKLEVHAGFGLRADSCAILVARKWYRYFLRKWALTENGAETHHVNTCSFHREHAPISDALLAYFCQHCCWDSSRRGVPPRSK